MKAAGALPTEERVKQMTDIQWIWYYNNLMKDNEETETLMKSRLDYLAFFNNPELFRSVSEMTGSSNNQTTKQPIKKNDVYVNDDFEAELKAALGEENLTELPGAGGAGNANMSQDAFLDMAMAMQGMVDQQNMQAQQNMEVQEDNEQEEIEQTEEMYDGKEFDDNSVEIQNDNNENLQSNEDYDPDLDIFI